MKDDDDPGKFDLESIGQQMTLSPDVAGVVIGFDGSFDFWKLLRAASYVHNQEPGAEPLQRSPILKLSFLPSFNQIFHRARQRN